MQAVTEIEISGLPVFARGKVRTAYDLGARLLVVATDRISAFDYVLPTGIPDKGKILTATSAYWFRALEHVSKHHMISTDPSDFPPEAARYTDLLRHRTMLVKKARRIDLECIVRGFLSGSAWKDYEATGKVAGHALPEGLAAGARLERPLFTPSTKSSEGHDRNITIDEMDLMLGADVAGQIAERSLSLFEEARRIADAKGITIVDTKFEFGWIDSEICLIDEIFTPDSSRFLARIAGSSRPINLDKQFVRDYLESVGWDKQPPAPGLPAEIVAEARRRYLSVLESLTGETPSWAR